MSKNFKNCVVCLEFQCPEYSQIINLAALNVEFGEFGYGLIEEKTTSVLDEIVSKTVHKHKEGDQERKKK